MVAVVVLVARTGRRRKANAGTRSRTPNGSPRSPVTVARCRGTAPHLATIAALGVLLLAGTAPGHAWCAPTVFQPELRNRDIVLCLDVSGSMTEYDAALVGVFEKLVERFDG